MSALLRTLSILALAFLAAPTFAQAPVAVNYECQDPTGFEVLAWITLTGTHYSLTSQMQVSGEGDLSLQDGGTGLVVLSGPLAKDFGLLGAKPASGPKLTFVDERGPVMICRQQQG
ncbi:MAG: hypothetical protein JWP26_3965 [Devosia sp.]|uniref:hypothetical protein n=1 Tax=Devosia sp. TaxID=1871048 RepID=UPI00262B10DA|nr:hypothetical protein [Devosia sp.]MDB5588995.1 hypothetical protein [Devosia sp.]